MMFDNITTARTVTVKVPSGEAAWSGKTGAFSGTNTYENWGNGFRGGGWNGSAFTGGASDINTNITLSIVYIDMSTISNISAYLQSSYYGGTKDNPIYLSLSLNLASDWEGLLSAIASAGTYVSLDLSACAMTGTEFDPGTDITGKDKIVSLVLPDAATSIKGGYFPTADTYSSAFLYFGNIKSVSGSNVETIGNLTFYNRYTLTTVSFPKLKNIGEQAFAYCQQALTTVSFPEVTSIGDYAFYNCNALTSASLPEASYIGDYAFSHCERLTTASFPEASYIGERAFDRCYALTTASLPKAVSIGDYAFFYCDDLTTVSLPKAASIGERAFSWCTALTTVTLGATAPTLGSEMFYNITNTRTVTVKVPSGATGYSTIPTTYSGSNSTVKWGNGFRGGGWTGSAFVSGGASYINSNITLVVQYQ
jgi:hypothetical protein